MRGLGEPEEAPEPTARDVLEALDREAAEEAEG